MIECLIRARAIRQRNDMLALAFDTRSCIISIENYLVDHVKNMFYKYIK
jgi:hypothetical protein